MNQELIHIDLFSGAGGFSLGFQAAGFKFDHTYYSEIDKHAIAVYSYKFNAAEYVGSVTDVSERELRERHPGAKFIVTFGFPCQDLSIAGKRDGLNGERSGLFFQAIRIIKELGDAVEVFIFENVKGLLSNNEGEDFEVVLRTIADLGIYECEWQLVNTSWLLPQNRERVYFIGHFAGRSKPRVFPFRESDNRNTKKIFRKRLIRGRNKNTSGCIDTRGVNAFDRADLDKLIYNYKGLKEVRTAESKKKRRETGTNDFRGKEVEIRDDELVGTIQTAQTIDNCIQVRSATKSGYETATDGDGINLENPKSKTRKGRVGKQKSQTINTSRHQGVFKNKTIRRLTVLECERLQGFPDNWTQYGNYDGEVKKVSKTQRYKLMGNAVTEDIVEMIGKRLIQK